MNNPKTFAYVLLSCSTSNVIHDEIRDDWLNSGGGILETFISLEGQADAVDDIWPSDWYDFMSRVAPAQLTQSWNPDGYLLEIFGYCAIVPSYATEGYDRDNEGCVIYFDQLPSPLLIKEALDSIDVEPKLRAEDKQRFDDVIAETINLARLQNRGILFIGDWGWDYDIDNSYLNDEEVKAGLAKHGLKFFNRHI